MITLLRNLSPIKIAQYDEHFEMVIKAIRDRDEKTLNQFYDAYKIDVNHPLKMVIDRLIEPNESIEDFVARRYEEKIASGNE